MANLLRDVFKNFKVFFFYLQWNLYDALQEF